MNRKKIFIHILTMTTLISFISFWPPSVFGARIKDIVNIQGVRNNQLMGYGLVIGLNGTGDDVKKSLFTRQSLINMVERLGIGIDPEEYNQLKTKNIASVMVTANLPPFARPGSAIDITVSSIGDASSLVGGSLLMTSLKGPDGKIYAVAQGAVTVGAISFGGKSAKVQKNHPTVGRIANGATIERKVEFSLPNKGKLIFQLKDADFTTSARMTKTINDHFASQVAVPTDSGTVSVTIPEKFNGDVVDFIAELEHLEVKTDAPARIVVNEKTGTIVMGKDVRISDVAVSHGNLNLIISEITEVSQLAPLTGGATVVAPQTNIESFEDKGNLVALNMGTTIGEIATALNAIGATPRDLIAIFQAIKAAGALHGELIIL